MRRHNITHTLKLKSEYYLPKVLSKDNINKRIMLFDDTWGEAYIRTLSIVANHPRNKHTLNKKNAVSDFSYYSDCATSILDHCDTVDVLMPKRGD